MKELEGDPTEEVTSPRRCGAKRRRDGEPCRKWPLEGTNRCRLHGGASPQAQRKARERIRDAADHAAAALIGFMNNADVPWPTRLAAARDLLDRADVTGKTVVEVAVQPWQALLDRIDSTRPGGAPELDPTTAAELDRYNREETDDDGIVEAELVEAPDNVTALRLAPAPLQTHAERYGDPADRKRPGSGPRVAGSRKRGPRDGH